MADVARELEIAHWVSVYSERCRAQYLGDPTLNDDGSGNFMFDVRFDAPDPLVALEVTSIVDPPFIATARIADPIADELTEVAIDEGLGRWYVNLVAGTLLRPIKAAILDAIRGNGDLPTGVMDISRADNGEPGVVIGTWSSASAVALHGFTAELLEAIEANVGKLVRAQGYERHLAVDLRALRARDPSRSPVPPLPAEIDVLWVIRSTIPAGWAEPMAWWSTGEGWSTSRNWWL